MRRRVRPTLPSRRTERYALSAFVRGVASSRLTILSVSFLTRRKYSSDLIFPSRYSRKGADGADPFPFDPVLGRFIAVSPPVPYLL
jgi:hypothetical protein